MYSNKKFSLYLTQGYNKWRHIEVNLLEMVYKMFHILNLINPYNVNFVEKQG